MEIAALYVETGGIYYSLGLDCWDIVRDAKNYRGPNPVIAHPPCNLWGAMANVNYARWGGEHNRPGNDQGCFASALTSVNTFGGVLEHPKRSRAFAKYGLGKPAKGEWSRSGKGWICEVWQSAYGHKANKATWLYYVGVQKPFDLDWSRPKGTHQIGGADQRGKAKNKPSLQGKRARATPRPFADVLISLAKFSSICIDNIAPTSLE